MGERNNNKKEEEKGKNGSLQKINLSQFSFRLNWECFSATMVKNEMRDGWVPRKGS